MKRFQAIRLLCFLLVLLPSIEKAISQSRGATYYVDSIAGNDNKDGASPATALKTLQAGVRKLNPAGGDTLVLKGTFQETLTLAFLNTQSDPSRQTVIKCAVDASGHKLSAIIDGGIPGAAGSFPYDCQGKEPGFGPGLGNYLYRGVIITSCNYVTIDGLEVRGIAGVGILGWKSSHLTLRNLKIEWIAQSAILVLHGQKGIDPPIKEVAIANCRINQSNLGRWADKRNPETYDMRSETMSIDNCDGFEIYNNHLANSLMEGIDFKFSSKNGKIHNNLVELTRSAAYYANEGLDTKIYQNIARDIGWYDPQDGSGIQLSVDYMKSHYGFREISDFGASAFLIGNGDLPPFDSLETGRVSGIHLFQNLALRTRMNAFSVWNEWKKEGRPGWVIDDIKIYNNVAFMNGQGTNNVIGAIQMDVEATNSAIQNNVIVLTPKTGLKIWGLGEGKSEADFYANNNVISHNLFYGNNADGFAGKNPLFGDPRFVNASTTPGVFGDFQLSPGSPAIDAGMDTGLPKYNNTPQDLGAYEIGLPVWRAGVVSEVTTSVDDRGAGVLPTHFRLFQNFPNPFNPSTTIRFSLPQREHVTLQVFDVNGREVATLVDGSLEAGKHAVTFAPTHSTSGLYFYKMTAGKFSQTHKAILVK